MKILLLEDNETLSNGIYKKLKDNAYVVDVFSDGEEGMFALNSTLYDLLILDLGLPSLDGIDIVKKLRFQEKSIPILIISARDKLDQRILGLETGADDYLCKPFALDEVIARVHALLRRSKNKSLTFIKYKNIEFDSSKRTLRINNKAIELTKRELSIFEHLLLNVNTVVSKENIVEHITSFDDNFNPTAIEIYISRLRKKLNKYIDLKTVRGLGYILNS